MAEKKSGISYEQIIKDLKARKFAPVYVLMGDDSFYIDKICDFISENVLKPEEQDFNQTVVFGADVNAMQVVDMCKGYPMMAEYRVVVVKEAQNLRNLEPLEKYLLNPVKTTILVLCHKNGSIDRRKKFIPQAEKVGVVFESKKLYDRQLPGFIETYLKSRKSTIEPKATQMIADHIGADLHRLTSELDKLLISLPEKDRRVTPEFHEIHSQGIFLQTENLDCSCLTLDRLTCSILLQREWHEVIYTILCQTHIHPGIFLITGAQDNLSLILLFLNREKKVFGRILYLDNGCITLMFDIHLLCKSRRSSCCHQHEAGSLHHIVCFHCFEC